MHLLLVEETILPYYGVAADGPARVHRGPRRDRRCRLQAALAASEFDLAVLDLGLPDGDGMDLLARWRHGIGMPLLVLTARGRRIRTACRGLQASADDYLLKPFDLDELVAPPARPAAALRRSTPWIASRMGRDVRALVGAGLAARRAGGVSRGAAHPAGHARNIPERS